MSDMMTFPETVEEFMESYKITDTKQVYTNGTELVPIFRMNQWFDHSDAVEVVRCKDCKWSDWYKSIEGKRFCYCMETGDGGRTENDFCSYGERKDGEQE